MLNKDELEKLRRLKIAEYFTKERKAESIKEIEIRNDNCYTVFVIEENEEREFIICFEKNSDEIRYTNRLDEVEIYEVEYIPDLEELRRNFNFEEE